MPRGQTLPSATNFAHLHFYYDGTQVGLKEAAGANVLVALVVAETNGSLARGLRSLDDERADVVTSLFVVLGVSPVAKAGCSVTIMTQVSLTEKSSRASSGNKLGKESLLRRQQRAPFFLPDSTSSMVTCDHW